MNNEFEAQGLAGQDNTSAEEVAALRRAHERARHANRVLKGIRALHRDMAGETCPKQLTDRICTALTTSMGYNHVWIALMDARSGAVSHVSTAGVNGATASLEELFATTDAPRCMEEALLDPEAVIRHLPETECGECPLRTIHEDHVGLCRQLTFEGHCYGVIAASVPAHLAHAEEEQFLFAELAEDVARALDKVERASGQAEAIIASIHGGTARAMGEAFFPELVAALGKALNVDYALVSRVEAGARAQTLALWHNTGPLENVRYPLKGTPCADVTTNTTTCFIAEGVQARFPEDAMLVAMGITGYAGAPLCDESGKVLGTLAVMHTQPLAREQVKRQVLEVFAARASAELARLEAEVTLHETRERMALALESTRLGTWDWDIPSGALIVDARWAEMLGYAIAEAPSDMAQSTQLVHPEDLDKVLAAMSAHIEGHTTEYETEHRLRTPSGDYVWVLDRGRIIARDDAGNPVRMCGTHQDITERKTNEQQLADAKQRMELALEGAALGTWDWHVPSGHVVFNARWAEMLGYRLEELEPNLSTWKRLVHEEDMPVITAALTDHLEGRTESYDTEHRVWHRDGSIVWIHDKGRVIERDEAGKPIRVCGTHLDITERKQAEQRRDITHQFIEGVVNQCPVPLVIVRPDGSVQYNTCCAEVLEPDPISSNTEPGVSFDAITPTWKLFTPSERELPLRETPLQQALEGQDTAPTELRVVRADGTERWIMAHAARIYSTDGQLLAAVAAFPDITEFKRTQSLVSTFFDLPLHLHMIIDDQGVIQRVNRGWQEALGYRPEEMEGRVYLEFVHPDDVAASQNTAAFISEGNQVLHFENRYRHKEGGYRLLSWASRYLPDHSLIYGTAEDVTERRAAEEALRESELRYRQMFQNNLAAKLMIDPDDGRILEASLGAERLYGYDWSTLTKMKISDINTLSDEEVRREMEAARREERMYFNFKHRLASGEIRDVEVYSGPVMAAGREILFSVIHDVSDRNRALEQLARSERRYRGLLETTGEGFWFIDSGLKTAEVNAALCKMLGYAAEEIIGRSPLEFADKENQAIFRRQFQRISSVRHRNYEITLRRKDGTPLHARLSATTLYDSEAVMTGAFALVTDVTATRQAEEALRASEYKLRSVFKAAPIGLAIMKGRTFQEVNHEWERITGYTHDELIGNKSRLLYASEREFSRVGEVLSVAMESRGVGTTETQFHRKTGEVIDVMVSCTPVDTTDLDAGYTACIMDITEQNRYAEALRAREADLKHAQAIAKVGSYRWNMVTGEIVWSDQLYENFGVTGVQPSFELMLSLLHPDDRDHVLAVGQESRESGKPFDVEYRIVRPNGDVRHVRHVGMITFDEVGSPLSMFGTSQDITEQKEAEKERDRLIRAIEQAAESVVITDVNGNIQYVNPAFERTTGYTRDEAMGANPRILKSGETDPAVYRELWDTLVRGETWSGHLKNRRKDGRIFTEEAVISPVQDNMGKTVNYVAVKRDITDEIQLETQYRQAQKMEAIGQLTGGVAHDFNNLLQVMNMGTELARDELSADHPALEPLHQVSDAGARAARLVSQLLLFSRRQVMQPEILDLNVTVSELMKMLGRVITENINLEWQPMPAAGFIHADRGMVEQALVNLTVNARDAMPQGGSLFISTRIVTLLESNILTRGAGHPGTFVVIEIRDTGHGMDEDTLSRIFEPFFTTKEVGKGTGLGLATVYGILDQHKGWVTVTSTPGEGTCFELYWPAHAVAPKEEAAQQAPQARGGRETILLAEDDPLVRSLGGTILTRAGYTVLMAEDGAAAVEIFKAHEDEISLVVLDLMMPIMDGREAYDQIRALSPDARVLFASGYSEDTVSRDFVLEAGLNLIQKPFTREKFLDTVRKLLDA